MQDGDNPSNGNNNDGSWLRTIVLNLDNISRVESGNRIELQFENAWKKYEVINNAKAQRTIDVLDGNSSRLFTYGTIIRQRGQVLFRFHNEYTQWTRRIEVPREFRPLESLNWKILCETIR